MMDSGRGEKLCVEKGENTDTAIYSKAFFFGGR